MQPRHMKTIGLILTIALFSSATSFAQPPQDGWLLGVWEGDLHAYGTQGVQGTPRRFLEVTAVAPDGTAQGTWAVAGYAPGTADIRVMESQVHIVNAVHSVVELTREGDDRLTGRLTIRSGQVFALTLLKMKPCTQSPVTEQSVGPPKYCVGDTWRFSSGRVQRVAKLDGDGVVMTNPGIGVCPGCFWFFDQNLSLTRIEQPDGAVATTSMGFIPGGIWKYWEFPLETKKQWRIDGSGLFKLIPFRFTGDCTVEAYEDVTTKAGTFKAFKVVRQWVTVSAEYSAGTYRWYDVIWFAPAVKTVVKFKTTHMSVGTDEELVSYSLR